MTAAAEPVWRTQVTCVDLGPRLCRVASCRSQLPARRTAYCSDRHAREFERNHSWFAACHVWVTTARGVVYPAARVV